MAKGTRLIRKQVLLAQHQVQKLEQIAAERGTSFAQVVRQAIDAYDPEDRPDIAEGELADYVAQQVKDALKSTRRANRQVKATLQALDKLEGAA